MNHTQPKRTQPSFNKNYLTPILLIAFVIAGLVFLSGCQRKNFIPQITQTALKNVKIEGSIIHTDFLIAVQNPTSSTIEIIVKELEIYKNYEHLLTELEESQAFTLAPGPNTFTISLEFHQNTIIENAIDLLLTSTVEINLVGNLEYQHPLIKGKLPFNEVMVIDIRKIMNSFF